MPASAWAAQNLVLVSDPWCPVACAASAPRPGYMVEIAKAVFEPAGYRVDYQVVPFARAEMMINNGEAAGFLGVLKLPKRQHWVFPASAQATSRVCFYTRPSDSWTYSGDKSLHKLSLGTIRGYSYGAEIDQKLALSNVDEVGGIDAFKRNVSKLMVNHLDAIVEYELVAQYQFHQAKTQLRNAGCGRTNDSLYIGFSPKRRDARELAQLLDEGVNALRKSGQLKQILQSYGVSDWVVK
ncbi:transporter substrate-binding domain-containing protein [Chitinibacter bivalviorum]|uniref:Transporter substrate-binding domain-containing protein n=1 Tax=Chitinibacter bivalviorum TaxID=2739434 RepID=A0A7H9BIE9_9NEIS|nr:transporter substrate-binding domain-containing protein [Chitinibacter bivalviorum]QLG87324.1 transporter substrate-binding domain-containing protein [Chitinibacter bivalviorum]